MAMARDVTSKVGLLKASPTLAKMDLEILETLAAASQPAVASRGEIIWLHGSQVGFIGLVESGFVKMVRTAPTGTDTTVEIMGPGQIFGLLGCIESEGCPLSARAVCEVRYLRIPKPAFLSAYQASPAASEVVLRQTTRRLRHSYNVLSQFANMQTEARIAAVLFHLAESYGHESEAGLCVGIPLTRQDIAEMVGTTVESAIRVMSKWQKAGWIQTEGHVVTITDLERVHV